MKNEAKSYISLYNEVMNDKESQKIEYTISERYVGNLKPVFGIKEVIANFYDANGTDFIMNYEKPSLILKDNNIGVNIKYMIIGNSGSRENSNKIGEHGEGYKIGALTIVREGGRFLIHTVGYTIAFGMEYSDILKTNVMFAKYKVNNKKIGTEVFMECSESHFLKAKRMFLLLNDFEMLNENIIITNTKLKPIYLNGLEHVQKNSIFSYNFKQKNLISNRDRNYISQEVIDSNLRSIYENLNDRITIKKVMNSFIEYRETFDKMLEARVVESLNLNAEQSKIYKNSLNKEDIFTSDNSLAKNGVEGFNVVKVSPKLLLFLSNIGANVIENENESEDKVNKPKKNTQELSSTITISKIEVSNITKIENKLTKLLHSKGFEGKFLNNSTAYYKINNIHLPRFSRKTFFQYLQSKSYMDKNNESNEFDDLIYYLIQLSCNMNYKVKFYALEMYISIKTYLLNEKYHININVENDLDCIKDSEFAIIIEKECEMKEEYERHNENFIYFLNLKYKEINSLYSYRIKSSFIQDNINQIIKENILNEREDFYELLLDTAKLNLYEHEIEVQNHFLTELNTKQKEKILKVFENKYSRYVIPCNDQYDKVMVEKYNYKLFKSSKNFAKYLSKIGIKNSREVFSQEQNNEIVTLEITPEIEKAIELFRNSYNIESDELIPIYLAITLPNNNESLNRNGVIYISSNAGNIPEYLAALIGYEFIQSEYNIFSPSHALQNHLTHCVLG